eukprot:4851944-Prymnesium_polylepis.1
MAPAGSSRFAERRDRQMPLPREHATPTAVPPVRPEATMWQAARGARRRPLEIAVTRQTTDGRRRVTRATARHT